MTVARPDAAHDDPTGRSNALLGLAKTSGIILPKYVTQHFLCHRLADTWERWARSASFIMVW